MKHFLNLLLFIVSSVALAQSSFWKDQHGKPTSETESRRSKNDFAGWLLVTSDQDWQERWEKPTGPPSSTPNPDFRRFPRFNLNEINELEA
jgi:hypothetical protein